MQVNNMEAWIHATLYYSGCCCRGGGWWCNGAGDIFLAHFKFYHICIIDVPNDKFMSIWTKLLELELRQFWRLKRVPPFKSKVYLIKWLVHLLWLTPKTTSCMGAGEGQHPSRIYFYFHYQLSFHYQYFLKTYLKSVSLKYVWFSFADKHWLSNDLVGGGNVI